MCKHTFNRNWKLDSARQYAYNQSKRLNENNKKINRRMITFIIGMVSGGTLMLIYLHFNPEEKDRI